MEPEDPKPKNKAGRPKGAKSRPKWLLKELKKAPKRPVGRPPKEATRPRTLEELIAHKPVVPPPRVKKSKGNPRPYLSRLKEEDPEKFAELSAKGSATPKRNNRLPGRPLGMTNYQWAVQIDEASKIAKRIIKQMDMEEALPQNPLARKAMEQALSLLSIEVPTKDRLAAIRTILEYNMAKPAATQNVTVRTAEDFLDEIGDT